MRASCHVPPTLVLFFWRAGTPAPYKVDIMFFSPCRPRTLLTLGLDNYIHIGACQIPLRN